MLVLGSTVLIPVLVIPIIMFFICLVKLWILFISMFEILVIVSRGQSGGIFTRSSGLIKFSMKLIHLMKMSVFGKYKLFYIMC